MLQTGEINTAQLLLRCKANLNQADHMGATPLFAGAQEGMHTIVEMLLLRKANINQNRVDGISALSTAAYNGHTSTVELLLQHKADASHRATEGLCGTALMYAVLMERHDVVKVLNAASSSEDAEREEEAVPAEAVTAQETTAPEVADGEQEGQTAAHTPRTHPSL